MRVFYCGFYILGRGVVLKGYMPHMANIKDIDRCNFRSHRCVFFINGQYSEGGGVSHFMRNPYFEGRTKDGIYVFQQVQCISNTH